MAVQAEGCAPVVCAWEAGKEATTFWEGVQTVAAGLSVGLILRVVRETEETALVQEPVKDLFRMA